MRRSSGDTRAAGTATTEAARLDGSGRRGVDERSGVVVGTVAQGAFERSIGVAVLASLGPLPPLPLDGDANGRRAQRSDAVRHRIVVGHRDGHAVALRLLLEEPQQVDERTTLVGWRGSVALRVAPVERAHDGMDL